MSPALAWYLRVVLLLALVLLAGVLTIAGWPDAEPAEDCVAWRERWVSDLILAQRPGCHPDSWSGGLYCNNDAGGGSRVASRAY